MVRPVTLLAGVLTFAALVGAAHGGVLATDGNAMADWQGTRAFDTGDLFGITVFTADIDYAVYAPGTFSLTPQAGAVPEADEYVYAYQIVDVADGVMGTAHVERYSVGLNGGNEQPGVIGYVEVPPGDGDVNPSNSAFGYLTAGWDFNTGVYEDEISPVLYFSSPFGPEWDTASVTGTMSAGDTKLMPSPAPEPGTIALLAVGAAALLRRRNT